MSLPFPLLAAVIAAMLFSSCQFNLLTHKNLTPVGASHIVRADVYDNTFSLTPVAGGDVVLQRVGQHSNIHLVRLDDSLKIAAEYSSPSGRFQQQPLGIVHRDNRLYVISAEYTDNDTMSVMLRQMEAKTLKEQEVRKILTLPRRMQPYQRTEFAIAFSPDSSAALVYAFDLNMIQDLPAMLDAVYVDFKTLRHDTLRMPAPISPGIKAAGYANYLPRQVVYEAHLTGDGRAYFMYHRRSDSVFLTCYDIPDKSFTNSSASLPGAPCDREDYRFCGARSFLGHDNSVYVAALDYEKRKVGAMTIAKFDGRSSGALFVRRLPLSPSLAESITSLSEARAFTIVDLAANPQTMGGTILLQPYGIISYRTSMSSSRSGYIDNSNNYIEDSFHHYGDLIGITFDGKGERVWESVLAPNSLKVYTNAGPYTTSRISGDSIEIVYAGRDTTDFDNIMVMKVSQRTGGIGTHRPLVQYRGNIYFDLRRSYDFGKGHHLWYANVGGGNSPELVRAR